MMKQQDMVSQGLNNLPDCRQCRQTWHTAVNVGKLYKTPFTRAERQVLEYYSDKMVDHIKTNHGKELERNGND